MKAIFNAIKAKILSDLTEIKFVAMYNGQFEDLDNDGNSIYSFPTPFMLIEFDDDIEWHQLGNGIQIADPLFVTIHIGHNQYDAQDGTQEQNLDVYDLADRSFLKLNKFEPTGCVQFIRVGHTQDKHHTNLYHFQQKYRTNYIDNTRSEPVNGINSPAPLGLDTNVTYNPSPIMKGL